MNTTFTDTLTINAPGEEVVIDGIDFCKNARIEVISCETLVIKNCRFYDINQDTANSYSYVLHVADEAELQLIFDNNYIGSSDLDKILYIEGILLDDSSVSNNHFDKECSNGCSINICGIEDNATIIISGNLFEDYYSPIIFSIGAMPVGNIKMSGNIIHSANIGEYSEDDVALVVIEPLGTETETYEGLTIYLNKTTAPYKQIIYGTYEDGNTVLDSTNSPLVLINGIVTELTIYS